MVDGAPLSQGDDSNGWIPLDLAQILPQVRIYTQLPCKITSI